MPYQNCAKNQSITPPPPISEVIDYQGKIAELVATMSLHEQEQALKMIEILALKLD
jgi:hypothetical protein